jgi:hypothetical protein
MSTPSALYKAALELLDPENGPVPADPDVLRAFLCVHSIVGHTRWLEAACELAEPLVSGPLPDDALGWLRACGDGWVQRASGPFRAAGARLAEEIEPTVEAVPTLLLHWRTTGRMRFFDLAAKAAPSTVTDLPSAAAMWAMYEATASEENASAARDWLEEQDVAQVHPRYWPMLADALELDADAFDAEPSHDPNEAAHQLIGAAAVALPPLVVHVHWWIEQELQEGPMAEAATFPWPSRRLRYHRLPYRDQLRVQPFVGDVEHELVLDVGVVAEYLAHCVSEVDRSALVGRGRRRRSGSLLRR